jgi:hypothetical protein
MMQEDVVVVGSHLKRPLTHDSTLSDNDCSNPSSIKVTSLS